MISTNASGQTFPGLTLKAWALVDSTGTLIKSFNVTSISKGATGNYTANFTTNLATTTYIAKVQTTNRTANMYGAITTRAVASSNYVIATVSAATPTDMEHYVEFWE